MMQYLKTKVKKHFTFKRKQLTKKKKIAKKQQRALINQLLDTNCQCPYEIVNCEALREQLTEITSQTMKIFKGCSKCQLNFIKQHIIAQIIFKDR
jgi:hypothetical protein